ncbi:hypothetical protein MMPV_001044 [Pyropia vietnamensis]
MLVPQDSLPSAWRALTRPSAGRGPVLIFAAAPDVDAVAATATLAGLLRAQLVRYEVHPVVGYGDLVSRFRSLTHPLTGVDPRAALCVNCGARVDLEGLLLSPSTDAIGEGEDANAGVQSATPGGGGAGRRVRLFVLDSHRPVHLAHVESDVTSVFVDAATAEEVDVDRLPMRGFEDSYGFVEVDSDVNDFSSDDSGGGDGTDDESAGTRRGGGSDEEEDDADSFIDDGDEEPRPRRRTNLRGDDDHGSGDDEEEEEEEEEVVRTGRSRLRRGNASPGSQPRRRPRPTAGSDVDGEGDDDDDDGENDEDSAPPPHPSRRTRLRDTSPPPRGSTPNGGSPTTRRRPRKRIRVSAAEQSLRDRAAAYYARGEAGAPSSVVAHRLARSVNRASPASLWHAAIGASEQLLFHRSPPAACAAIAAAIRADLPVLFPGAAAAVAGAAGGSGGGGGRHRHDGGSVPDGGGLWEYDDPDEAPGGGGGGGSLGGGIGSSVAGVLADGTAVDADVVLASRELRLDLLRHSSLLASLTHSAHVAARVGAWHAGGRAKVAELLATLGIPASEASQRWPYMRRECPPSVRAFGLGDMAYDSFLRVRRGHRGVVSAADAALCVAATLELGDIVAAAAAGATTFGAAGGGVANGGAPGGTGEMSLARRLYGGSDDDVVLTAGVESRFWKAYDGLGDVGVGLDRGLSLAAELQQLIAEVGGEVLQRRGFVPSGPFRYAFLRDTHRAELCGQPLLLVRLGLFLRDALRVQGGRDKPFVIVARVPPHWATKENGGSGDVAAAGQGGAPPPRGGGGGSGGSGGGRRRRDWLAVAVTDAHGGNAFGAKFRAAAARNGSAVAFDGFDAAVVEVADGQETEFIRFLHDVM